MTETQSFLCLSPGYLTKCFSRGHSAIAIDLHERLSYRTSGRSTVEVVHINAMAVFRTIEQSPLDCKNLNLLLRFISM